MEVYAFVHYLLDATIFEAGKRLSYNVLKPQQFDAVKNFILGRDVFVTLPTGLGMSAIFGILPVAFDLYLKQTSKSIVGGIQEKHASAWFSPTK